MRKNRNRVLYLAVIMCMLLLSCLFLPAGSAYARNYAKKKYNKNRWTLIKKDFLKKDTDRLILVKYKKGSKATLEMWKKVYTETVPEPTAAEPAASENAVAETPAGSTEETTPGAAAETSDGTTSEAEVVRQPSWKKILSCSAYVGLNGINKVREGDKKTPVGAFHITMAFGIKKSPGTAGISYTRLNKYYYWSGERDTYNTFVDVRDLGRSSVAGEHLISYKPFYNYSLAMDFNKKGVFKKGSAIFLHCTKPGRKYTAGCIAVAEKKMKKIVKNTTKKTMIFIYPK